MALRSLAEKILPLLRLAPQAINAERQGLRMLAYTADGQGPVQSDEQQFPASSQPLPDRAEIEHAVGGHSPQSLELETAALLDSNEGAASSRDAHAPHTQPEGAPSDRDSNGASSTEDSLGNGNSPEWQATGKYAWNKDRADRKARRALRAENHRNLNWQPAAFDDEDDSTNGDLPHQQGPRPRKYKNPIQLPSLPRASVKVHYPVQITNFGRLASRRDVQRLLWDCAVPASEVRLQYDLESMLPKSFYVNLFTPKAQAQALEKEGALIAGRPIHIKVVTREAMQIAILNPLAMGSKGRFMLVHGIQENANLEDIVRFFHGYELMGNPVTVLKRSEAETHASQTRLKSHTVVSRALTMSSMSHLRALVRFSSTEEAQRAMRERQGDFLLNGSVVLRVLQ